MLWDVKSREVVQVVTGHGGVCFWVDVFGDLMVSAGQDGVIRVYRERTNVVSSKGKEKDEKKEEKEEERVNGGVCEDVNGDVEMNGVVSEGGGGDQEMGGIEMHVDVRIKEEE